MITSDNLVFFLLGTSNYKLHATSPLSTFQEITIWSTHTIAADTYDYFSILSSKPNHDYEVYYTSRHKDRGALKEDLKAGKTEIPQSCYNGIKKLSTLSQNQN